jgi:hypothetical protein
MAIGFAEYAHDNATLTENLPALFEPSRKFTSLLHPCVEFLRRPTAAADKEDWRRRRHIARGDPGALSLHYRSSDVVWRGHLYQPQRNLPAE